MRWTVQDEINLQHWIDDMGIQIVYLPQVYQWGYVHKDKPKEIIGGFPHMSDLKQHLVNLKGDNKNVLIVSEGDFQRAVEKAGRVRKPH